MRRISKLFICAVLCILLAFPFSALAVPYQNYTYSEENGQISLAPHAYLPARVISSKDLAISDFKEPEDIFCDSEGLIYILDSGNSRVVVLNSDFTNRAIFEFHFSDEAQENADILEASGIFVDNDYIYIADTAHARIVVANKADGSVFKLIGAPKADALGKNFIFKPSAIAVDGDKLLYVVGEGTYEGIINMDLSGEFLGFFGSNAATTSAWDLFWRRFSTKQQRKTMLQLIPQDFSGIDIDAGGFIYTTTYTVQENSMVKRLNPGGSDIIRNQSKIGIIGDVGTIWSGPMQGKSSFLDVAVGPDNIYACLDYKRGKIFCYDNDGYMLYNFGTQAQQTGGFTAASALTYLKDNSSIAVLDKQIGTVTVFEATDYAKAINTGIHYERILEYETAAKYWKEVITLNNNCDFAHDSLGQYYYNSGDYSAAKREFKRASNKQMYSKAIKETRDNWLFDNIGYIMASGVGLVLLISLNGIRKKRRKNK